MDDRIYYPTRAESGVYLTRRLPKGSAAPSVAPVSGGGTPLSSHPVTIPLEYNAEVATHVPAVERWSYTVPSLRRAKCEGAAVGVSVVVAGGAGRVGAWIAIRRNGSTRDVYLAMHDGVAGAALDIHDAFRIHTGPVELFEGDRLRATTQNVGGGTIAFLLNAVVVEFDAIESSVGLRDLGSQSTGLTTRGASSLSGSSKGGVIIRSESARDSVNWINLGDGYWQRRT